MSNLFMVVTMLLYWPTPELAFLSDNTPVSWLSSAQLWALVLLSLRLTAERTVSVPVGLWLVLAMAVLAFDEQFMFHEQWKYGCHQWWEACGSYWVTEAPIIMLGCLGIMTAMLLHSLLPSPPARALLWSALAIGGLAISLDLFRWSEMLAPYEEGLEVLAEALFAGVLLGWLPPVRAQVHSP